MRSLQRCGWVLLPGFWLTVATASAAEFSGTYQLQNVVDNGTQVSATLVVDLSNNSGSDVVNATVSLIEAPLLPVVTDMTYPGLTVNAGGSATLQATVTVPESLYQQWQSGGAPYLLIQYIDGAGATLQFPVDVTAGGA